jgi:hypothetical protein
MAEAPIRVSFRRRRNGVMVDDDNVSFDMDDEIDIYLFCCLVHNENVKLLLLKLLVGG